MDMEMPMISLVSQNSASPKNYSDFYKSNLKISILDTRIEDGPLDAEATVGGGEATRKLPIRATRSVGGQPLKRKLFLKNFVSVGPNSKILNIPNFAKPNSEQNS